MEIIDFHTHLWPIAWGIGGSRNRSGANIPEHALRRIVNPDALVEEFAAADISRAVISTTIESLFGLDGEVELDVIRRINDWLVGVVAAHPEQLVALGMVDAFSGDAGAIEAEQAITELKLCGLVIDSSRHGLFLGDSRVRPTLEVAARHNVPIFVHPVDLPDLSIFIAGAGPLGNSLGRGLMNGAAFLSVLRNSILERFPSLSPVFAALGLGAIIQASRGGKYDRYQRLLRTRPNLYFDTMGEDPGIVKVLADFLEQNGCW